MAKRPDRSEADESAATQAPRNRERRRVHREVGPAAVAGREPDPNKIQDDPTRIQQAPGDAMSNVAGEPPEPAEEEIRARAYQMYLERGGEHGMDFDDWLRAERELKAKR